MGKNFFSNYWKLFFILKSKNLKIMLKNFHSHHHISVYKPVRFTNTCRHLRRALHPFPYLNPTANNYLANKRNFWNCSFNSVNMISNFPSSFCHIKNWLNSTKPLTPTRSTFLCGTLCMLKKCVRCWRNSFQWSIFPCK